MRNIAKLLSLLLLFTCFIQSVMACGPFTVDPLFSFTRHPDYPLNDFAKGKVGIVPTSYGRMSLFLFYRQLNGLPLSPNEQKQYLKALSERIGTYIPDSAEEETPENTAPQADAAEQWKTARAKVFSGDPNLEKVKRLPDDYFYYTNCLDDAFRNAAQTLEDRISKNGINDDVKEWLNGQDAVFGNCSSGSKIPDQPAENAPDWLKKDRQYQISAALFYAGSNEEARAGFEKISRDGNSPWKNTAKFVIARTFIREASLIEGENRDYEPPTNANSAHPDANLTIGNVTKSYQDWKNQKAALLQKADSQLKIILSDPSMKDFHASAKRLLNLVAFRSKPREQRRKLADNLVQSTENLTFYNDLVDYIWLLDKIENDSREAGIERERKETEAKGQSYDWDYDLRRQDIPNVELGADLTDWLFTFQTEDGYAHSFAKWKENGRLHWFVAAITGATRDSNNLAEILSEADKIQSNSPAFATVRHHQIRLLIETGKQAEARQKLEDVLANLKNYPPSTQNDFTSQRMKLAENLGEFLKYSQRRAVTFVYSDDANEVGVDMKSEKELAAWQEKTMFDYDSTGIFNEKMPLSLLRQAALNPNLPEHLKKFLVIAVWTRAFVLGNSQIHTEFTPLMNKFAPEYKVLAATSEANSLLAIGRNPVIQIYVPTGYGRGETGTTTIDSIRGNWWCVENSTKTDYPSFMTAAQKSEAEAEQKKLAAAGESATFLARRAVDFANKNMANPNTPEILHLAVRATRYGCRDNQTLRFSKAAFDILHKRFPANAWTKKTPYFFGETEN